MREPSYSGKFKRDVKAASYLDHPLKGRWRSFRDAHIEPDWLLIYKLDGDIVKFERTGSHADLFE